MNIQDIVKQKEYAFLNTDAHLKDKLVFLTFGGSHAYGTATPESDVDIRGCVLNSKADLIGMSDFEQMVEATTDTTIYSFKKLVGLLLNTNPNTIEMLGCKPEHYLMYSPVAQELIDNRNLFLSRRAINSFGSYASQQLRRLQNAVARDALPQAEKEKHILNSIKNTMLTFNDKYQDFDESTIKIYIDKSDKTDLDAEIFIDANLQHYPLRDYKAMFTEMHDVVRVYGRLNHRNRKKDEQHLNKHAMHLVRLFLMELDILEKEEIITYRENDLPLLREIRNGKYMNDDGTYQQEFFELVNDFEQRLEYAANNTSLPANPDYKRVEEFVMSVNERVVKGGGDI
jgi:predicted nucleotidyltransferase